MTVGWLSGCVSLLTLLGLWPGPAGEARVSLSTTVDAQELCVEWTSVDTAERRTTTCAELQHRVATLTAPTGRWDVRVMVDGYAPVYRWDIPLAAGETVDVGPLQMVSGASVTGWIAGIDLDGEGPPALELALRRKVYGWFSDPDQRRKVERVEVVTQPRSDGFFQITGVAAGSHELLARIGVGVQVLAEIELSAGEAVELAAPFVVQPPRPLQVYVDPPVDGVSKPWTGRLKRQVAKTSVLEKVDLGTVDASGVWTSRPIAPGLYELEIADSAGSEWHTETVEVDATRAWVEVSLDLHRIRGTLSLGDEPLAAEIIFGTIHRRPRISLRSDDEGRFEGALPQAGDWPLEIALDGDLLLAEPVRIDPDDDPAEIEIELPDTRLAGKVTRHGHPASGAIVTVRSAVDRQQIATARTRADGSFAWRGLPEGDVAVSALVGRETSAWELVSLRDGGEPPEVELRIETRRAAHGQLLHQGVPVVGAEIDYLVGDPSFMPHPARTTSDLDGRFELAVEATERHVDVVVVAPGAGVHIARFELSTSAPSPEAPIVLPTWHLPGTLALHLPIDRQIVEEGDPRWVTAGRAKVAASVLTHLALRLGALTTVDNGFWLDGLGVAEYQICDGPVGPCQTAQTAHAPPLGEPVVPRATPGD